MTFKSLVQINFIAGILCTGTLWHFSHARSVSNHELVRKAYNVADDINRLGCVATAGAYGARTVHPKIFWIQGLPAILAFAATYFA